MVAVAGCRGGSAGAEAGVDASADAHVDASADAHVDVDAGTGTGTGERDGREAFDGDVKAARSIGHTSVVFKVELASGKKAAWKPATRRGPLRYKGEIAARRLGIALGLVNVPRVWFRALDAKGLTGVMASESAELFAREAMVSGGMVKGALIPWIDGLEFLALERAPLSGQWKQWLRKGETIPDDQRELARQVSTLVAFDFVTGNWDRWSGGNVGIDKATGTLLFIDNDGAFFEVAPLEGLARNKKLLVGIDRFSRSFVTHVRDLDDAAITAALGEESPGVPLLSTKAVAAVLARRKQLLQIIDGKLADGGDDALFFP
jgi:hypothetical protein